MNVLNKHLQQLQKRHKVLKRQCIYPFIFLSLEPSKFETFINAKNENIKLYKVLQEATFFKYKDRLRLVFMKIKYFTLQNRFINDAVTFKKSIKRKVDPTKYIDLENCLEANKLMIKLLSMKD
jgi:hypothetical protein